MLRGLGFTTLGGEMGGKGSGDVMVSRTFIGGHLGKGVRAGTFRYRPYYFGIGDIFQRTIKNEIAQ